MTDVNAIKARWNLYFAARDHAQNLLHTTGDEYETKIYNAMDSVHKLEPDVKQRNTDIRALLDRIAALETALQDILHTPTRAVTNDFDNGYNAAAVTLHEIARRALD